MITIDYPDGTLIVTDTAECAAYIQYANRLDAGPGDQEHEFNGVVIRVIKGDFRKPETVVAYAYGQEYSIMVDDFETGELCVPYWEGM